MSRSMPDDAFEHAYAAGITRDEGLPIPVHEGRRDEGIAAAAALAGGAYALGGCILTPDRMISKGYVVVGPDGNVAGLHEKKPTDAAVVETGGVILPGLIDLHNHPDFNIFAAWEPPTTFINRMQWRGSDLYKQLVRTPWNTLQDAKLDVVAARYAEVRSLVGGTTAIQGASPQFPSEEALVRNVDKRIFGEQIGRSMVDLDERSLGDVLKGISDGDVKAFYVHSAEGQKDNAASHNEFAKLVELKALVPQTVIIHGTALGRDELQQIKDAGAKLVWSPQSNLRLYQQTTSIKDVVELEVPWALGADWLPSGSRSLLDEMRVARHEMAQAGLPADARTLVQTVTRGAAAVAALEDKLGFIDAGRPADLLVLERHADDPWESVLAADPASVQLVTIQGDLAYGRQDWLQQLGDKDGVAAAEPIPAWGKWMILDTTYAVKPTTAPPRLAVLRAALIGAYPNVGPIFA
jgi:cytosine/adenosine deaminase-related metal-dependent hydrolase